jgi:succinate dehydrogenase/fumarate reductase flavoprotein subunit
VRGRLIVAGGGMAGLVAAVRARQLGAEPVLYEKGDRLGGSMLLSSGVIWRHADWDDLRAECPGGDESLQRLIWERLDDGLDWLRRLGAPVVRAETGNPRTRGVRFDPAGLTATLAACVPEAGVVHSPAPLEERERDSPLILATGGFAASPRLLDRYLKPGGRLRLRANPWSSGDGLVHGLACGAACSSGMAEFYGRNMPATQWTAHEFVQLAQLYARHARIFDRDGVEFFAAGDVSWSETNVVQATARRPGASAYYLLTRPALAAAAGARSVAELVEATAGPARLAPRELPFDPPAGTELAVRVEASVTHTIGGLRTDARARVLGPTGDAIDGLYAAGVDAGGIATGGYQSGLAQALVLGLAAAESACAGG